MSYYDEQRDKAIIGSLKEIGRQLKQINDSLCRKQSEGKQINISPIEKERWDIAKIMADNFHINGEGWDESDFEWTAHCVQMEGYRKMPDNIGEFSDGYHTFNELYHHRAVLFSVICNMFPEKAWKSKLHDTGDMYDGMFIVGIETEQGQATYHYDIEPYWDMFKVKELEKAPKYDGHTPSEAIARIGNLPCEGYRKQSEGEWVKVMNHKECSVCGYKSPYKKIKAGYHLLDLTNFCPNCGAKMKGGAE